MALDFLEAIYEEANVCSKIKDVLQHARAGEKWRMMQIMNRSIIPSLLSICKKYSAFNREQADELLDSLKEIGEIVADDIYLEDTIEKKILPLLQDYLKQYREIKIEDEKNGFLLESSDTGFLTIKDLKRNCYFHSTVDPMDEARLLAERLYNSKKKSYCLLGCGLGYLAYQLYQVSQGSVMINLYDAKAEMITYAREYGVLNWIPEDRIQIKVMSDIMQFLESAEEEDTDFYIFQQELYLQANGTELEILRGLVINYNTTVSIGSASEINFLRNIHNKDVNLISELDISCINKEFVLVAAGPSLDRHLETIRNEQGKKTIIAVGRVFRKLIAAGIKPDYVVILETQEVAIDQINGLENETIPLLLSWTAYWEFSEKYCGEKYLIPIATICTSAMEYAAEQRISIWDGPMNVSSLAIDAAAFMGAEKIYLYGLDLSFPNEMNYAEGLPDRKKFNVEELLPVEAVRGGIVYTDTDLNMFREEIEDRIMKHNTVVFYNMSECGAKIKGTIIPELSE